MSVTLQELGDFLRDEEASIHISSRKARGVGKTFIVSIIRETPPHASSTAASDDLDRAITMVMGDL